MNRFVGKERKNRLYSIKFKSSSASSAFWFLALYRKDKTRNLISRNLSVNIRESFYVEFDRQNEVYFFACNWQCNFAIQLSKTTFVCLGSVAVWPDHDLGPLMNILDAKSI